MLSFRFWYLIQNRRERYESMYQSYPEVTEACSICFEIQPVYFCTPDELREGLKRGETNGTACVLWESGWGDNQQQAHQRWLALIQQLLTFFVNLATFDGSSGQTVSKHMFP